MASTSPGNSAEQPKRRGQPDVNEQAKLPPPDLAELQSVIWQKVAPQSLLSVDGLVDCIRQDDPKTRDAAFQAVESLLQLARRGTPEEQQYAGKVFEQIGREASTDLMQAARRITIENSFSTALQTDKLDVLLTNSMDFMLRQVGYCNMAIWLCSNGKPQLGAYMKYTIPASEEMMSELESNSLRQIQRNGFLHTSTDPQEHLVFTPSELRYLPHQDVMATCVRYLGEPLAIVMLFRDNQRGFTHDDERALKIITPVFSVNLARVGLGSGRPHNEGAGPHKSNDPDWWKDGGDPIE